MEPMNTDLELGQRLSYFFVQQLLWAKVCCSLVINIPSDGDRPFEMMSTGAAWSPGWELNDEILDQKVDSDN